MIWPPSTPHLPSFSGWVMSFLSRPMRIPIRNSARCLAFEDNGLINCIRKRVLDIRNFAHISHRGSRNARAPILMGNHAHATRLGALTVCAYKVLTTYLHRSGSGNRQGTTPDVLSAILIRAYRGACYWFRQCNFIERLAEIRILHYAVDRK